VLGNGLVTSEGAFWHRQRAGTGRSRGGIGIPGIGGIGIPGIGGMGRGRGNSGGSQRGGAVSPYEGTVRWESARPVLDAMKSPLPEAFEGRYVISVSGIPLMGSRSVGGSGDDDPPCRADGSRTISTV
jgi:hypothetical protein